MARFRGLSKVQVNLEDPVLFQWSPGWTGLIWDGLDATGHLWMPRCLGVLIYWVFGLFVHRGPWSQYHRYLQCAQYHDWFTHLFGLFCQVRWSSDAQSPGKGCTIIAKKNSQIQALDSVYVWGACMFYPLSISQWHTLVYIYCSVYFVFLCQLEVLGYC